MQHSIHLPYNSLACAACLAPCKITVCQHACSMHAQDAAYIQKTHLGQTIAQVCVHCYKSRLGHSAFEHQGNCCMQNLSRYDHIDQLLQKTFKLLWSQLVQCSLDCLCSLQMQTANWIDRQKDYRDKTKRHQGKLHMVIIAGRQGKVQVAVEWTLSSQRSCIYFL